MTTWILLRGLTRESGHWGDFLRRFQQEMPGSEVLALDLPGNGALHRQRSPARVQDMVAHCRAEVARRGIRGPVHLLAMSLGAMVAVAWADAHPQEVAVMVLVNTSLRPYSRFYQRLRPRNYGLLLRLALLGGTPQASEAWERGILRITSHTSPEGVLPLWLALRGRHPVSRANALRQLWAAARYRAPAQKPAPPILLLASIEDQLVSVACSEALALRWHCELKRHPRAGHDLPLDDGDWVIARIGEWPSAQQNASASQAGSSTTLSKR